ncbi:hypothetical protein SKAU_G00153850 [Synaphobranchus kaupii]|uniref:Uncharacterized protein n=1 Tax=Synaphobranchus kaupii TaxID=118154 RepID=A0A9Q1IZ28_SYNKA|nr:hypothetical protein SKAU_G00153850 [Synaphobranchus kaupii]
MVPFQTKGGTVFGRRNGKDRVWSHPAALASSTFCSGGAGWGRGKARENGRPMGARRAGSRQLGEDSHGGRGRSRSRYANLGRPAKTAFF